MGAAGGAAPGCAGRRFARAHRLSEARTAERWAPLSAPQAPVPAHGVRTKARLLATRLAHLEVTHQGVKTYRAESERLFATRPAAEWMPTLPGGKSGTTVPTLWADLGAAPGRWTSWPPRQAQAGRGPVTVQRGKRGVGRVRGAWKHAWRQAGHWLALGSRQQSTWAHASDQRQRARGRRHNQAVRAWGAKGLKMVWTMWNHRVPYDEQSHLANRAKPHLRATA